MQTYETKPETYFARARTEILPLVPEFAEHVLEIGCGSGATLAWLKSIGRIGHTTGIELAEHMAEVAVKNVDQLIVGDAESLLNQESSASKYDLVLCLDVLEHMLDPWEMMRKVSKVLKPGGVVIASIPNVRHLSVMIPLLTKGHWTYSEEGVLDRTHLRFFTKQTASELMETGGLTLTSIRPNISRGSKSYFLGILTLGFLNDFLAVQYLVSVEKKIV